MTSMRVLAPVDFSDDSVAAAERAAAIAKHLGAELTLYHVDRLPAFSEKFAEHVAADVWEGFLEARSRAVQKQFDALTWPAATRARKVECVAPDADIAERVARFADAEGSLLVVMGSHGAQHSSRFLLGSVTAGVAAITPCPLLVLRNPGTTPSDGQFRRVLLAIGRDEIVEAAIALVRTLATSEAFVDIVHVVEPQGPLPTTIPDVVKDSLFASRGQIRAALGRQAERLRAEGHKAAAHVEEGDAAPTLLDRLVGSEYDLVVAGVRSKRRRPGALGTVTGRLLHYSPIAVAVFPVD